MVLLIAVLFVVLGLSYCSHVAFLSWSCWSCCLTFLFVSVFQLDIHYVNKLAITLFSFFLPLSCCLYYVSKENKIRHNKTRQDKTRKDKTRQGELLPLSCLSWCFCLVSVFLVVSCFIPSLCLVTFIQISNPPGCLFFVLVFALSYHSLPSQSNLSCFPSHLLSCLVLSCLVLSCVLPSLLFWFSRRFLCLPLCSSISSPLSSLSSLYVC